VNLNECRIADALDEDVAGFVLLAQCRGGDGEHDEQEQIRKKQGTRQLQEWPPWDWIGSEPGPNFAGYHKMGRRIGIGRLTCRSFAVARH